MKKIVLTSRQGKKTATSIFSNVNDGELVVKIVLKDNAVGYKVFPYDKNVANIFSKAKIRKEYDFSNSIVIRWGNRQKITGSNIIEYNNNKSLYNASNKKLARKIMSESKILVPKEINLTNSVDSDYPVIARPHHHSKGRGFIVLKNTEQLKKHYDPKAFYYSKFINKTKEYRVHVAHSKVIAVMEKPKPEDSNKIAWNLNNNNAFKYIPWSNASYDLLKTAIDALKALELDFGGVDIIEKDNKFYVLEVNSAPSLCPYVTARYSNYFNILFTSNSRKKHWDYLKFHEAKSLIWKNKQIKNKKICVD